MAADPPTPEEAAKAAEAAKNAAELAEKVRKANAECYACHSEQGLKKPPRADMDMAKLAETLIHSGRYDASYHTGMDCKQCHGSGYVPYPHDQGAKAKLSPCSECHAAKIVKLEPQFEKSVHAKNLKEKMTCDGCHDPHTAQMAAKIGDPKKIVAQDNAMCLECHNSDLQFAKLAPEKKKRPNIDVIHEWLPNTKVHWQGVRCVECHTPPAKTLSHEILAKDKAEKNCVSCHSTNSTLRARLYRHLVEGEQQKYGFVNSIILSSSYMVGATRNPWIDAGMVGLFVLTVAGVLGHGAIRILIALIRRRKS